MSCECGAYKVWKAAHSAREHSDWCPWSPCYFEWLQRKTDAQALPCDAFFDDVTCGKPATRWVVYDQDGIKFNYCEDCWTREVAGSFSTVAIYNWGRH